MCIFAPAMKKKLLAIWLILCTLPSWGVEIASRKLNTASGLPDNNVRCLLQDKKGFIWMGTPGGLYRYDGYFYTSFKYSADGNNRLLNNNHITGLYAVDNNRLLVAEQGNMYSVYDTDRGEFISMSDEEKQHLYALCRERHIDKQAIAPHKATIENNGDIITDNLDNTVVLDNKGNIWFVDRKRRETIRMKVFDEALFPLVNSKKYKVLTSERHGLIWVSTNGCGITVFDRKTRTEQHIRQASGLISTDYIVDMCMDADENVWAADEFHGVVFLTPKVQQAEVRMLAPDAQGLRSNQVYVMQRLADSTMLVANTLGDVYQADSQLELCEAPRWRGLDVHSMCLDKEGKLWIGSRQRGLMTGDGHWCRHDKKDPSSLSADNVFHLLCDNAGRIWIAAEDSYLDLAVRGQDGSCRFRHFFDSKFAARILLQDSKETIWVGTRSGLFCFKPDELLSNPHAYRQLLNADELGYSEVTSIFEDSRGTMWVGTLGGGVFCNTGKDGTFVRNNDVHLLSYDIQSIVEDQGGVMWIATTNGLTCYDPASGLTTQYYDENNLLRNYYADKCACLLPDGRVALGTNSGILIYHPQKSGNQLFSYRLRITDVSVNGTSKGVPDKLALDYEENSPTIRFSAFHFLNSASIRYSYRLEGYDKDWSTPDTYSFASYRKLAPGRYVLHVKAYGPDRQEDAEAQLAFSIAYPWWRTWWAYLVYTLLAAGAGIVIYRQVRTVYDLRQRISIEKQLTEYKLQFFTNISHEFRTPLTIIRGAMDRIKRQPTIPAEMRQPVSNMDKSVYRMQRLIDQLLEFRKMENGKLRLALQETDAVAFLKDIFQNFRDIAENKNIDYTFLSNERSATLFLDRSHIDKVVYNLLSNAFKYTPAHGEVAMRVNVDGGRLQIQVTDSGVGIPKEKQPELFQRFMQSTFSSASIGIGLHLTKALVEVHHGTISYRPGDVKGSVFTVELPTDKTVYAPEDFLQQGHQLIEEQTEQKPQEYKELAAEPMNDREVLIVEDDSDVIDYLRSIMQQYFVVHTAMDGVEALDKLQQLHPDLIVSDIMMPMMDGLELTARIRQDEQLREIPVILLTAVTTDEKRIKAQKQGADAYITKPFDQQLLVATAVRLIQQRDQLKQRYMQKMAETRSALPEIIVDERDRRLLDAMNAWLSNHISDPLLSVDDMVQAMGYGRSVFYKKVKTLTGQTPADYIKTCRMQRAAEMLREETVTVSEVCYRVGISDPHYFGKVFKQVYGISPKKYQQGAKQ